MPDNRPVLDYAAPSTPAGGPIPLALYLIAALFITVGALAALDMLRRFYHDQIFINPLVALVFIGWGLLRLRRLWWVAALVVIWIPILLAPLLFAVFLMIFILTWLEDPADPTIAPVTWILLFLAALEAALIFTYRILTRPHIRRRFRT